MTMRTFFCSILAALSSCAAIVPTTLEKADDVSAAKGVSLWCETNGGGGDNGPDDLVELPEESIHVVRADMQAKAQVALAKRSFIELSVKNARPYLRDGESVSDGRHVYLVRAAAFYVNEKYDLTNAVLGELPIDAFYSPSREMLAVVNFALGRGGLVPSNLALIIESENPVASTRASCLSAE